MSGLPVSPRSIACFIVSVKDSLESILDLAKTEGMLFKWGSGTGTNLSALREEVDKLTDENRGLRDRLDRIEEQLKPNGASAAPSTAAANMNA